MAALSRLRLEGATAITMPSRHYVHGDVDEHGDDIVDKETVLVSALNGPACWRSLLRSSGTVLAYLLYGARILESCATSNVTSRESIHS